MKKTVIVMAHQENQATPMAADEARVSIVRMAQTVKRTRSARPRTRSSPWGAAATGAAAECPSVIRWLPDRISARHSRDNNF